MKYKWKDVQVFDYSGAYLLQAKRKWSGKVVFRAVKCGSTFARQHSNTVTIEDIQKAIPEL